MRLLFLYAVLFEAVCMGAEPLCVRDIIVPKYPAAARMARIQGSIGIDLEIGRDGKVLSAKALGGDGLLKQESVNNVRLWSFAPPGGKEFPIKHRITYEYRLRGDPVSYNPIPTVRFNLPDHVQITTKPMALETDRSERQGKVKSKKLS